MKKIKYLFVIIFASFLANLGYSYPNELNYHHLYPDSWDIIVDLLPYFSIEVHTNYLFRVKGDIQQLYGKIYRFKTYKYPTLQLDVTNDISSHFDWKANDIKWFCYNSKYDFDSSKPFNHFIFYRYPVKNCEAKLKNEGKYNIVGIDPLGKIRSTTYQSTISYTNYPKYFTTCDFINPESFVGKCNETVRNYIKDMYTDGEDHIVNWIGLTYHYQNWWVRRLSCLPIECSSGPKGNCSMAVISPHLYISAKHWGYWRGGTQKYVSDDLSITNIVKLDGKVIYLKQWAIDHKDEYGFSDESIQGAYDFVIGRYIEGAVDESMCPYFISRETMNKCIPLKNSIDSSGNVSIEFHPPEYDDNDLIYDISVLGWVATQAMQGWVLPCEFFRRTWLGYKNVVYMGPGFCADLTGRDLLTSNYNGIFRLIYNLDDLRFGIDRETYNIIKSVLPENKNFKFAPIWAGDSGLPSYLEYGDKIIILGQYKYVGGGPAYWSSFDILKAYIESQGDTMKEFIWSD